MNSPDTGTRRRLANLAAALLSLGSVGLTAAAQEVNKTASPDSPREGPTPAKITGTEADSLRVLAEHLARERSDLDARRKILARYRDRLPVIDRPAAGADFSALQQRIERTTALTRDVEDLESLIRMLTRQALGDLDKPSSESGLSLEPAPAVARARIDVSVRPDPDGSPIGLIGAGTLVIRLATDGNSGWDLVATKVGFGFVPGSQLRPEP